MKILNRGRLHEIAIYFFPSTDFYEFKRLYKKCTAQSYSFLVIYTSLSLDDTFYSWKNLLYGV